MPDTFHKQKFSFKNINLVLHSEFFFSSPALSYRGQEHGLQTLPLSLFAAPGLLGQDRGWIRAGPSPCWVAPGWEAVSSLWGAVASSDCMCSRIHVPSLSGNTSVVCPAECFDGLLYCTVPWHGGLTQARVWALLTYRPHCSSEGLPLPGGQHLWVGYLKIA